MKEADFSAIKTTEIEYGKIVNDVKGKYNCDWNDSVHNSFEVFVKRLDSNAEKTHSLRIKYETINHDIEKIKINELIEKSKQLSNEAKSI